MFSALVVCPKATKLVMGRAVRSHQRESISGRGTDCVKVGRSENTWHPRESLEYRGREGWARENGKEKALVVDALENKFQWGLLSYMKNSTDRYKH